MAKWADEQRQTPESRAERYRVIRLPGTPMCQYCAAANDIKVAATRTVGDLSACRACGRNTNGKVAKAGVSE